MNIKTIKRSLFDCKFWGYQMVFLSVAIQLLVVFSNDKGGWEPLIYSSHITWVSQFSERNPLSRFFQLFLKSSDVEATLMGTNLVPWMNHGKELSWGKGVRISYQIVIAICSVSGCHCLLQILKDLQRIRVKPFLGVLKGRVSGWF